MRRYDGYKTLRELGYPDGEEALINALRGHYGSVLSEVVASLTIFPHPQTAEQVPGALFAMARPPKSCMRNDFIKLECGREIVCDDNNGPHMAFIHANKLDYRPTSTQYQLNHVYGEKGDSKNPELFTDIRNLCLTPFFLARLTDTNSVVKALIRWRVSELFGYNPRGIAPGIPAGYTAEELKALPWATPLPKVKNVHITLQNAYDKFWIRGKRKAGSRTHRAVEKCGWLLNGFKGVPAVGQAVNDTYRTDVQS